MRARAPVPNALEAFGRTKVGMWAQVVVICIDHKRSGARKSTEIIRTDDMGSNPLSVDRGELAGLELVLDLALDLELAGAGIALHPEALELQDLERVDDVDARREREDQEARHQRGPPRAEVAVVV